MRESLDTYFRRFLLVVGILVLGLAAILLVANLWVVASTRERIVPLASCPSQGIGIVFGTSHWTRSGERNPHFEGRMRAAAQLMSERRLEHLLVSGDNATRYYNEPITMWRDLIKRGVRTVDMTLDYAGFSTFDTLVRARDVFGVDKAVLITQAWHLPRALFIADSLGIEAVGCAAPRLPADAMWLLLLREWMARAATIGDLYLWQRKPHFLGPEEPLKIVPLVEMPEASEPLPLARPLARDAAEEVMRLGEPIWEDVIRQGGSSSLKGSGEKVAPTPLMMPGNETGRGKSAR